MVSPCGRASHGSCGLVLAYNKNRSARGESDNRVCAQEECNCDLVARATRGLSAHGRARPAQRLPASAPRVRSAPALLCDNHRSRRPKACRCNPSQPARAAGASLPQHGRVTPLSRRQPGTPHCLRRQCCMARRPPRARRAASHATAAESAAQRPTADSSGHRACALGGGTPLHFRRAESAGAATYQDRDRIRPRPLSTSAARAAAGGGVAARMLRA